MNGFAKLVADIETLAKSHTADKDDAAIAAAAGKDAAGAAAAAGSEGGASGADGVIAAAAAGAGEGAGEGEGGGAAAGAGDEETLGKSITAVINGEEQQVIDATDMLKALSADVGSIKTERASENEHLSKALGLMADMFKSQRDQIANLTAQVTALRGEGRGRKAVVKIDDKQDSTTTLAKGGAAGGDDGRLSGLPAQEFMTKAMSAQAAGRLSAFDVSHAETCLNRGIPVAPHVVAAVQALSAS